MRFEELDVRLRAFETNDDHCVLPDLHIVVRFRDHMLDTVEHLMTACGFGVVYGYTQSDEISLLLRKQGESARAATAALAGLSVADKNELLFRGGIQFNDLPAWQKRGAALYLREEARTGVDPRTGAACVTRRRVLHRDLDLPVGDAYGEFVATHIG